ncbi:hypothetical protein ACJ41O_003809 [Fusarium nematophilum]
MADIYRGAEVTISAASAETSEAGFLGPREWQGMDRLVARVPLKHEAGPSGTAYVATETWDWARERSKDPINARAWTLQEHVLSSRILYYSSEQLYWMCKSGRYCDGGYPADGVLRPVSKVAMKLFAFPDNIDARVWQSLLEEYTNRKLSDPNDRYVAIDAVGRAIGKQLGTEYVCGLLANDVNGLGWRCVNDDSDNEMPQQPRPPYRALSWSWASIDGPIYFESHGTDWVNTAEILGWNVELLDPDARYGAIRSGEITIRAWAGSHKMVLDAYEEYEEPRPIVRGTDVYLNYYPDTTEGGLEDVWIVELSRNTARYTESSGIVLVEEGPGVFRRVGWWMVAFVRLSSLTAARKPAKPWAGGGLDVPLALDLREMALRIVRSLEASLVGEWC